MKIIIRASVSITVFLLVAGFFAFVAWCSGFDFNDRNDNVGFGVFMGSLIAAVAAIGIQILFDNTKR